MCSRCQLLSLKGCLLPAHVLNPGLQLLQQPSYSTLLPVKPRLPRQVLNSLARSWCCREHCYKTQSRRLLFSLGGWQNRWGKALQFPGGLIGYFFPPSQVQHSPLGSLVATEFPAPHVVWSCWGRWQRYLSIARLPHSHLPASHLIMPLGSSSAMPASRELHLGLIATSHQAAAL